MGAALLSVAEVHAPVDWVWHAKMIARSWEGARTSTIAAEVGSHTQTVRERIQAFNARGLDGLGIKPGGGRRPRLVEAQRSAIIALARTTPPGKLVPEPDSGELQAHDEEGVAEWTLDALAEAAQSQGIQVARSQVRRILLAEARALATHAAMGDKQRSRVCPKRTRIVTLYTAPPEGATILCVDELGPVTPRTFPPAPGWSGDGHRIKAPLIYSRGYDKAWVYGALRVRDGQVRTQTAPARNTAGYLALLSAIDRDNPEGDLYLITDNLSSHTSGPIREWLAAHPRVQQVFIPVGAAWLNLPQSHRSLVATLAPRRLCWPVFRRSRRDRPRHARGDWPAQSPRPSVGLGPSTASTPPASSPLRLLSLRNDALGVCLTNHDWSQRTIEAMTTIAR